MNLLLVEDNPGDARPLRELLRDSGLEASTLFTANTLKGATDLLSEDPVDVVLLDLSLPDSTGIDTVLGMPKRASETPNIVLTGLDDEAVAVQAVQAGAQHYLVKGDIDGRLAALQRQLDERAVS